MCELQSAVIHSSTTQQPGQPHDDNDDNDKDDDRDPGCWRLVGGQQQQYQLARVGQFKLGLRGETFPQVWMSGFRLLQGGGHGVRWTLECYNALI